MPAKPPEQPAQITPEMLAQIAEIMSAKEQAQRDARKAVWKQRWKAVLPHAMAAGWTAICLGSGVAIGIWRAGGIPIGPDGGGRNDAVAQVFRTQESAFRRLSGERAKALRAGQIASEKASADWMAAKYLPESEAAWSTLLTAEKAAFGGEQWTAEKEAAHIEGYVR